MYTMRMITFSEVIMRMPAVCRRLKTARALAIFIAGVIIGYLICSIFHPDVYEIENDPPRQQAISIDYCVNATRQPYFFAPHFHGRLGNQLFLYASAYGISRCLGRIAVFSRDWDDFFDRFEKIPESSHFMRAKSLYIQQYRYLLEDKLNCAFNDELIRTVMQTKGNTYVKGYLQSFKYFDSFRNDLLRQLRFKRSLRRSAEQNLHSAYKNFVLSQKDIDDEDVSELHTGSSGPARFSKKKLPRSSEMIYIGVHIRRGDIIESLFASFGYLSATPEYFKRATNYYLTRFDPSRVIFVVATDNLEWARANFPKPAGAYVHFLSAPEFEIDVEDVKISRKHRGHDEEDETDSNSEPSIIKSEADVKKEQDAALSPDYVPIEALIDFVTLVQCNHTLQSVGTFGWWAAFLNGGMSTYYAKPFRTGSPLAYQFGERLTDFYLPEWTPLT